MENTQKALNHFWKQQFESAKNPEIWLLCALKLKRAADSLFSISKNAAQEEFELFVKSTKNGTFKTGTHPLTEKEVELHLIANLSGTYFLLIGFAFENILKGILISKHPEYININKKINKKLITHDLISLAKDCGISLEENEGKALKKLTKDIWWGQRYPIPLELKKMISEEILIGATNIVDAHFPHHNVIEKLFKKLSDRYTTSQNKIPHKNNT